MCLYPKLILNPKYKANKKNGGVIPPVNDTRVLYTPIGCGKCIECKKRKANEWKVRLQEDIRNNQNAKFITLTFDSKELIKLINTIKTDTNGTIWKLKNLEADTPENRNKIQKLTNSLSGYEIENRAVTLAMRLFLERWRKVNKKSVRHWLITELGHGTTEHIHLHGILYTSKQPEEIQKIWKFGFIWPPKEWKGTYVNDKTINYITKYVTKLDTKHQTYKPIIFTTPGIGNNYLNRIDKDRNTFKGIDTIETYRARSGHKLGLPIYYRNKLFTEEQREQLWLIKLDKQERWVLGEKIDISNGNDLYLEALKAAQVINKEMGYGNDKTEWKRAEYEKDIRNKIQKYNKYNSDEQTT